MPMYTRRPVTVEARRLTGVNGHALRSWLLDGDNPPGEVLLRAGGMLMVITAKGGLDVPVGHYILRNSYGRIETASPVELAADFDRAMPARVPVATTEAEGIITGFHPSDARARAALKPGEKAGRTVISLEVDEFFSLPGRDLATKDFSRAFDAAEAAGTEVIIRRGRTERPLLQTGR